MNTYLKYLQLTHAIDSSIQISPAIDETAKQLLNVVALRQDQGKALTVSDAMALRSIASPATIHRKLDDLRVSGLIKQIFDGKNRRTKHLVLTELAEEKFSTLGMLMLQAKSSG